MAAVNVIQSGELLAPGAYPRLGVRVPGAPNRFWAVPVLGLAIKAFILIPVFIWLGVLDIVLGAASLINGLSVLFAGRYWTPAYTLALGFIRQVLKTSFYMDGLTDRYPGFGLSLPGDSTFSVDIAKPGSPDRGFALPILGGLARGLLLIPLLIWGAVIFVAASLAVLIASIPVLFAGRYPLAFVELARDAAHIQLAVLCYWLGLADTYPSFAISVRDDAIKGLLITLAVLLEILGALGVLSLVVVSPGSNQQWRELLTWSRSLFPTP